MSQPTLLSMMTWIHFSVYSLTVIFSNYFIPFTFLLLLFWLVLAALFSYYPSRYQYHYSSYFLIYVHLSLFLLLFPPILVPPLSLFLASLCQQDMQVSGVEDDSRALNIVIHKPSSNPHAKPLPILQANFIFADHIRCIIAKQRLAKGRIQARRMKMQRIAGQ